MRARSISKGDAWGTSGDTRGARMAERKAFLLRLAPEIYESLEKWAADDFRSVNGQIEFLLRRALFDAGRDRSRSEATPEKGKGASRR